jgi:hypothetical protein
MTTVVNTPGGSTSSDSSGMGMIIGVIVLLAIVFLIFFYGMPFLRGTATQQNSAPAPASVNLPDQVDVNVDGPK